MTVEIWKCIECNGFIRYKEIRGIWYISDTKFLNVIGSINFFANLIWKKESYISERQCNLGILYLKFVLT